MKPANDPAVDYKLLVQRSYDRCAADYETARQREANPELDLLLGRLPAGAAVLDLGCGAGVPIARALAGRRDLPSPRTPVPDRVLRDDAPAGRCRVTGVDISGEQIRRAQANVPGATFIQGDMMALEFPTAHFDAVVAFYSIFHLPREEHPELLRRVRRWLKPGGYLLATVAEAAEAPYTEDDFFGVTMYWSNYGLEDYERMLTGLGFSLLETRVIGHGYSGALAISGERHPLMFARLD